MRALDRLSIGALLLLAAQPILPLPIAASAVVILAVVQLARAIQQHLVPERRDLLLVAALALPFVLLAIASLVASDHGAAWAVAERTAALAVLPICLLLMPAPPVGRTLVLDVFSIAAVCLGLYANVGVALHDAQLLSATARDYREAFATRTGIHAVYAAYYFFAAALIQLHAATEHRSPLRWSACAFLVLCGLLLASRMPIIAFACAAPVILFRGRSGGTAKRAALITLALLVLSGALLPSVRERMHEAWTTPAELPSSFGLNSVSERIAMLHCSVDLLEEHVWIGMGPHRVRDAMDDCLRPIANGVLADGHHGPHMQPLLWWIGLGLPGLFAFVLLFGLSAQRAWRRHDHLHLAFLLFFLLSCLTEDVLDRQWGVLLFAFLNAWMLAEHKGPETSGGSG
ncbi:MAG: O-antigen ligase family protein [Flavobacteriales bacterium]|nr:O-antigen ligase family protein [Flavobacteriales bacterium]MBP6697710.1 O-antigen ligase family protein [Flavobacteriales bacterium]